MENRPQNMKDWIGRVETVQDVITPVPYAALSATLDRSAERPAHGAPVPPLWHWLYCLPLARRSELDEDGHVRRGGFLPPVPLPRRMWAGGQFSFALPLRVGDTVTRTSTIEDVADKTGKSGPLVFVRVRHELDRGGARLLTERQNIVYRQAPKPGDPPPPPQKPTGRAVWKREWKADDVMLFRYSALTFNAHRIHFDRRYVTEKEGYPGLVVHGPLTATLLLELLRQERPAADVVQFEFRAVRPLFDGRPFLICGEPLDGGKSFRLWAQDDEGWLATEATAVIR